MGGDVDPRLPIANTPDITTEISEDILIGDGGKIVFDQRRQGVLRRSSGTRPGRPSTM